MTKEHLKDTARAPAKPASVNEDATANDRPTVNPPFDVEAFARASSVAQEERDTGSGAATQRPPPPVSRQSGSSEPAGRSSLLSIANDHAPSQPNFPALVPSQSGSNFEGGARGPVGSTSPDIADRTLENPAAEMRGRFALGDYTGALEVAELLLAEDPSNLEAAECGENCRTVLEKMYTARLGPLDRVPSVTVPRAQMRWLSMDHRAGFILSLIDGSSTMEMLLDVCGMPRLDALRILQELAQRKIVAFR